jgi:anti-sigma B factor antagonist
MIFNMIVNGDDCRIAISGEIDERGAEELKKRFREVQSSQCRRVTIDFKGISHIGSAGIGKLLVLYKDLAVRGAALQLVNVSRTIYRLLCEMKLNAIFSISEATNQPGGNVCGTAGH